jgi:hypothetical protein
MTAVFTCKVSLRESKIEMKEEGEKEKKRKFSVNLLFFFIQYHSTQFTVRCG